MKVLLIVIIVLAVIVGLMLTLRSSRNAGMPGEDVIKRAKERTRAQEAAEKDD
jgi:flagellar basal body-associated protein FliL